MAAVWRLLSAPATSAQSAKTSTSVPSVKNFLIISMPSSRSLILKWSPRSWYLLSMNPSTRNKRMRAQEEQDSRKLLRTGSISPRTSLRDIIRQIKLPNSKTMTSMQRKLMSSLPLALLPTMSLLLLWSLLKETWTSPAAWSLTRMFDVDTFKQELSSLLT